MSWFQFLNLSGVWSCITFVTKSLNCSHCLVFIFVLFPHPSDQSAERSHMSTTAQECSEDAEIDSQSLPHWLTEWQCHLLSCPGQLKKGKNGTITLKSKQGNCYCHLVSLPYGDNLEPLSSRLLLWSHNPLRCDLRNERCFHKRFWNSQANIVLSSSMGSNLYSM